MAEEAPGTNGSKFEALQDFMVTLLESLPSSTRVGMLVYPNMETVGEPDPEECFDPTAIFPIAPLSPNQRDGLVDMVFEANLGGTSPTHDAYAHSLSTLELDSPTNGVVVLITDSVPTYSLGCIGAGLNTEPVDPAPIVAEAEAAYARGIRTAAVGWFTSDLERPWLSRLAVAGGTAPPGCTGDTCHLDPLIDMENLLSSLQELSACEP